MALTATFLSPDLHPPAAMSPDDDVDERLFRTELIFSDIEDGAWTGQRGWSLYVDGALIAHTATPFPTRDAHYWASTQLGEGMTWLPGHTRSDFYWVATPERPVGHRAPRGAGRTRP